jgi:hypothetical protein
MSEARCADCGLLEILPFNLWMHGSRVLRRKDALDRLTIGFLDRERLLETHVEERVVQTTRATVFLQ